MHQLIRAKSFRISVAVGVVLVAALAIVTFNTGSTEASRAGDLGPATISDLHHHGVSNVSGFAGTTSISRDEAIAAASKLGTPTDAQLVRVTLNTDTSAGTVLNPAAFPGITGPLWAITLRERPAFSSEGIGRPYEPAPGTTTYNIVLVSAENGQVVAMFGGEH
jgi:hypothetical protein